MHSQGLAKGFQTESPDIWLTDGNPWEMKRDDVKFEVGFGGKVERKKEGDKEISVWIPEEKVCASGVAPVGGNYVVWGGEGWGTGVCGGGRRASSGWGMVARAHSGWGKLWWLDKTRGMCSYVRCVQDGVPRVFACAIVYKAQSRGMSWRASLGGVGRSGATHAHSASPAL